MTRGSTGAPFARQTFLARQFASAPFRGGQILRKPTARTRSPSTPHERAIAALLDELAADELAFALDVDDLALGEAREDRDARRDVDELARRRTIVRDDRRAIGAADDPARVIDVGDGAFDGDEDADARAVARHFDGRADRHGAPRRRDRRSGDDATTEALSHRIERRQRRLVGVGLERQRETATHGASLARAKAARQRQPLIADPPLAVDADGSGGSVD